ncbi:MAG: helix-turn-helix transcriptional regulator [Novosphingobium sp.]|nr:helix-turn-helix transcriptional regulator [Novosphingobium sp.]
MPQGQIPVIAPEATIIIDAELRGGAAVAQIVRYDIPAPTESTLSDPGCYQINLCLTPRPLNARACYHAHWGPHRFERLGDIFMIPPGEALHIKGDSGRQASLLCFLDRSAVNGIIGHELVWTDQKLATTIDLTSARVRALLFRLTEEVRHPGFAADRMLEFLTGELAIELARFCLEVDEQPAIGGLAGWRLRLIDERLSDNPTAPSLGELAELCNISVRQLTRGFKVSRGCSIGIYIESRRMESAKRLLVAGENVKTIAFAMGFSSPSSFTFAFRRAVGISPSQFRQRQTRGLLTS